MPPQKVMVQTMDTAKLTQGILRRISNQKIK